MSRFVACWFVSDIHIRTMQDESAEKLLRFFLSIEQGKRKASHIFLVGDIFDLWVGSSEYYAEKFRPLVQAIERLAKSGIQIYFFEGNHDFHVTEFWTKRGVLCVADRVSLELQGLKLRIEHGDFINPADYAYLRLRRFLRSLPIKLLAASLSAKWIDHIGQRLSEISSKRSRSMRKDNFEKLRELIRNFAIDQSKLEKFDVLITGHMHVEDEYDFEIGGRKIKSINLGSWFEGPRALKLEGSQFVWDRGL